MSSVLIIGGGAAGMAAAIAAGFCKDSVTLVERMDRVGKKLLATGNGRCNLMNTGEWRYPGGEAFASQVLKRCGPEAQERFWQHIGLRMRQEEGGRVYPISGAASTVLDVLRQTMTQLGVETVVSAEATALRRTSRGWMVEVGGEKRYADRVIVCGGGCAQPKLGSNGSAYALLTSLGHRRTALRPALTQIITETAPIRGLSGIRARCTVRITGKLGEKYRESGEVLFADYGVSGVCVMQCARYAAPGNLLHLNLAQAMGFTDQEAFRRELMRRQRLWADGSMNQLELLTGLCVSKMAITLMRAAGIEKPHERPASSLTQRQLNALAALVADFPLVVKGVKDYESAQVTAGGIAVEDFDPATMASRLAPGIHAAGEVLDVDGDCGGFNLMFAFGSGLLAGLNGRPSPWESEPMN